LGRSAKQKAATRKLVALNKKRKKSSTKKGGVRKTARKAFTGLKRKTNKAKTKRRSVKRNSVKSVLGSSTLKKVALGVGGATLATAMISFIAPNSSIAKFAAPAGAYALGGLEGIIGQFALGMLTPRPAGNQNVAPAMEVL
jgi:hypothetical protein|tara:strand:+ start:727 stop:1149 length:423 start_codon:yes stop_codon:yes gene_type:complete